MNNSKLSVLICFGGQSSEHEISCMSAASILRNIDYNKYDVLKLGITKEGEWLLTGADVDEIENCTWINNRKNRKAVISPASADHGILAECESGLELVNVDCIFSIIHGINGEDGTMQGLFELSGISYVGAGVCSSACSMDKSVTKMLVAASDVKQADCFMVTADQVNSSVEDAAMATDEYFCSKYPLFIKPASEGSSVGISKATNKSELKDALFLAAKFDRKILIEEAIAGRELEVAVLGNDEPRVSAVGEILAGSDFYDYDDKYVNGVSQTRIASDLGEEKIRELRLAALTVYMLVDCKGLARVDFFLKKDGTVIFNEINTLPGFTNISMYPRLWEDAGLEYDKLIDALIELAME